MFLIYLLHFLSRQRAGLASTFRSLYFYEWIPATLVFLIFNIFCQLCYYQSSNLVVLPPKLPLSLLAATQWVHLDMYENMGKFCTDSSYNFVVKTGHIIPNAQPNCTDSVMIIDERVQKSTDKMEQITLLTNGSYIDMSIFTISHNIVRFEKCVFLLSCHLLIHTHSLKRAYPYALPPIGTVLNEDLNCDGAVNLHLTFLVLCYVLVGITFCLVLILFKADREIRAKRKLNHYFTHSGKDLDGDKVSLCYI